MGETHDSLAEQTGAEGAPGEPRGPHMIRAAADSANLLNPVDAFRRLYDEGRVVFFVGAGASRESGVPMPDQMLCASAQIFLPQDDRVDPILQVGEGSFHGIQPEVFYEHVLLLSEDVEALHLWRILSPVWLARRGMEYKPNPIHLALAAYANRAGTPIFTTNFDTLIEDGARDLSLPALHVVTPFSRNETLAVSCHLRSQERAPSAEIFKLHGSIMLKGVEALHTLQTTMESITAVNKNVLRLLRFLSETHHLVFVGYSGSDIDYFPVLASMDLRHRPFWFNPRNDAVTHQHASRIGAIEINAFPSDVFTSLHPEFWRPAKPTSPDCGRLFDQLAAEIPVRLHPCQKELLLGMCLNSVGLNREAATVLNALLARNTNLAERDRVYACLQLARVQDCVSRYERAVDSANAALDAITKAHRMGSLSATATSAAQARALYHRAMAKQQQIGPNIRYGALRWRPRLGDMLTRLLCDIVLQAKFVRIRFRLGAPFASGRRDRRPLAFVRAEHAMNDHLMMLFGRVVSLLEGTRLIGFPGLRLVLRWVCLVIRRHAWASGDYFVFAGAQKYLQRLQRNPPPVDAAENYMLLRDPLNLALVSRDTATRLLERGDKMTAAAHFRKAFDASMRSGSAATAIKALVGLRACGETSGADEGDLRKLSAEVEGAGYRRFRDWLFRDSGSCDCGPDDRANRSCVP